PSLSAYRLPLRTPAEYAVLELVYHRSFSSDRPSFELYTDLFGEVALTRKLVSDRLQMNEHPEHFDDASNVSSLSCVPRYDELTQQGFDQLRVDPSEFAVARMVIRYPPIPAGFFVRYDAKPDDA
ncbi:MAG: hypothetical protein AAGB34_11405, partial [Planctomycetota bacterium]